MIEINLLPGGARKKAAASTGPAFDWAALTAGIAKFGSPYVMGAAGFIVLLLGAVAFMFLKQAKDASAADARLIKALDDSTRYAAVVAERATLEAKRDTLLRQVNLIRSIDEDRYIWPHIMDEVDRALPAYTWMTFLQIAGTPQGSVNVVAAPKAVTTTPVPGKPIAKPKPLPTVIPKDNISFRITGRTVDLQALTRYMRDLSLSPFIDAVELEPLSSGQDQGKEMFQFTLSMKYKRPDSTSAAIRRVPLVITVR